MQISSIAAPDLSLLGREAIGYLLREDYASLASRFGYALKYDRDPTAAIEDDMSRVLGELGATSVQPDQQCPDPWIGYFKSTDGPLLALVEYQVCANNGAKFLVELIATGGSGKMFLTLEGISIARPNNSLQQP